MIKNNLTLVKMYSQMKIEEQNLCPSIVQIFIFSRFVL